MLTVEIQTKVCENFTILERAPNRFLKVEALVALSTAQGTMIMIMKPLRTFVWSSSWLPPLSSEPSQKLRLSVGSCNTATSRHFPEQNVIQRPGKLRQRVDCGLDWGKTSNYQILAAGSKDKMFSRFSPVCLCFTAQFQFLCGGLNIVATLFCALWMLLVRSRLSNDVSNSITFVTVNPLSGDQMWPRLSIFLQFPLASPSPDGPC